MSDGLYSTRKIVCEEYNDAYCAVSSGMHGDFYAIWTGSKFITGWYTTMEAAWRAAFASLPIERRVL